MTTEQLTLELPDLVSPPVIPGTTIGERFEAWHQANPWVLTYLERKVADLEAAGATRVGIGQVWEVLRYDYRIATRGDGFRANNNWRSRYARLLIERHPEWADLIETRELRAP